MAQNHNDVFLIDPTISARDREKLMGAFVLDPKQPLRAYEPEFKKPMDIISGVNPQPSAILDVEQTIATVKEGHFKANLQRLVKAHYGSGDSGNATHRAKSAQRYFMENPGKRIEELLRDKDVRDAVAKLYTRASGEPKTLYFVAHIVTFDGWTVEKGAKSHKEFDVNATVKDPTKMLGPVSPEAELGGGRKREHDATTKGGYKDEMIFCVGYHAVQFEKKPGWRARFARSFGSNMKGYAPTDYEVKASDLRFEEAPTPGDGHMAMGGGGVVEDAEAAAAAEEEERKVNAAIDETGFRINEITRQTPRTLTLPVLTAPES